MYVFENVKLQKKNYNKVEEIFFLTKKKKGLLTDLVKETFLDKIHLIIRSQSLGLSKDLEDKKRLLFNKINPFFNKKIKNAHWKRREEVNRSLFLANSLKKASFGNTFEINGQVCFYPKNVLYGGDCFYMAKLYFLSEISKAISNIDETFLFINTFFSRKNRYELESKTVIFAWVSFFKKYKLINVFAKQNVRVFCIKSLDKTCLRIKYFKSVKLFEKLSFRKYLA